ncbi:hypothetical protein B0H10DRAFT_2193239 [Mycena sp. CBHHK59/15]|nr:hypothetical protein B0H10DRAFT_2193239 [Mycena sp. CBHHK59/15]
MPRSKKKQAATKLVQAKKNMEAPQTTQSRVKLRIIGPKAPVDASKIIENAGSESPPITPPPQLSPRTLQAAVDKYLESRKSGATDLAEEYSDGAESETEVLIQKKHQASSFHGGLLDDGLDEGGDSRSDGIASRKGWQAGEDEDEKTSSEEDDSDGDDLLTKLADTMSIALKHLMELVSAARRTISNTKSKKEFVVELKDLDTVASGKGPQKRGDSDSDNSEAASGEDEVDGKKVKSKKKSLPQLVAQLEIDNACDEHGGHGCLKFMTGHVQLSKQDLSTWAIFLVGIIPMTHSPIIHAVFQQNGYPSTTTPPPKLQVGGNNPSAKKAAAAPAPQPPIAPMAAIPGMPPFGYPAFPWHAPWPPYHTPAPSSKPRYDEMPSSDPVEEVEDATLFPRIHKWLQELDEGVRGHDGHNFAQFADDFEREKYMRIVDLEGLKIKDLKDLIPEIAQGTAAKMLGYAAKDIVSIRKRERKRARKEKNGPGILRFYTSSVCKSLITYQFIHNLF